ncbi:MAG: argininosuccinate lyase, partial [Firmicutes bacterium]|nr:argininosuccinate lyase [Bacillota bacterium]
MDKIWTGRFSKELDETAARFNNSLPVDKRMYRQDILGSMAHAAMLGQQEIISEEDAEAIVSGLEGILADIDSGALVIEGNAEDIHSFVEAELTARIGDAGRRLHTGRSRNDQVATDLRLYLRERCEDIYALLEELIRTLARKAEEYSDAIMPGYTHLQRAQPLMFGHHLLAYCQMFLRDRSRFLDASRRMNRCPLGAGALAGATFPIDRDLTSDMLGFDEPCSNSMDAVSDRDFCLELASCCSIAMAHLSRLAEELILWCSWEFRFVKLDDAFATGSSMMPQKKNPDMAELIRGKSGRVFGRNMALLTMVKGLPL